MPARTLAHLLACFVLTTSALAQCLPQWRAELATAGLDGTATIAALPTPTNAYAPPLRVFASGNFHRIGIDAVGPIAVLENGVWRSFGLNAQPGARLVHAAGTLWSIGDRFDRYDPSTDTWITQAQTPAFTRFRAVSPSGRIISASASNLSVSEWTGTQWQRLGGPMYADVRGLYFLGEVPCVWIDARYADQTHAAWGFLIYWDGSAWQPAPQRLTEVPLAMGVFRDQIVAFQKPANGPRRLELGTLALRRTIAADITLNTKYVPTISDTGERLAVIGALSMIDGLPVNGAALWDGTTWSALPSLGDPADTPSLAEVDGQLVAELPGVAVSDTIAVLDQGRWRSTTSGSFGGFTSSARYQGRSFAVGAFLDEDTTPYQLAVEDAGRWTPLAPPPGAAPRWITSVDGRLFFVGFLTATGVTTLYEWDGTQWNAFTGDIHSSFQHLLTLHQGNPVMASGGRVIAWNGTAWVTLGKAFSKPIHAIRSIRGKLIAATEFGPLGLTSSLRTWNGTAWVDEFGAIGGAVYDVIDHPDGIIAAGLFQYSSTGYSYGVARFAAGAWQSLAFGTPVQGKTFGHLYAGDWGLLAHDGSTMWSFDGSTWTPWLLSVAAPVDVGSELDFIATGKLDSGNTLYRLTGCDCFADYDRDGTLDLADLLAFGNAFDVGVVPYGQTLDLNADGFVDVFDFIVFVDRFEQGC